MPETQSLKRVPANSSKQGCWPTAAQRLLLRASLLSGEACREAWDQWRVQNDLDDIDAASMPMLGFLYTNLSANRISSPELPRLKGLYRFLWARCQQTLRIGLPTMGSLHDAGIPMILCKGTALNLTIRSNASARQLEEIDVLVPREKVGDAIHRIEAMGWNPRFRKEQFLDIDHTCSFSEPNGPLFHLHWRLFRNDCQPDAGKEIWERALPADWNGVPVRVPDATDLLLHICEQGVRYNPYSPMRWLADATLVIQEEPSSLDWERLAEAASSRDVALPVHQTLHYLSRELDQAVPEEALDRLKRQRPSLLARLHQRALCATTPQENQLPFHLLEYLRLKRAAGYKGLWRDWATYFESAFNLGQPLGAYALKIAKLKWLGYTTRLRLLVTAKSDGLVAWHPFLGRSDITKDVYAVEMLEQNPFCWTKAKALFQFSHPAPIRKIQLKLPPIPGLWDDLQGRGFQILVNGSPVDAPGYTQETHALIFDLPTPPEAGSTTLQLLLRVEQPLQPQGDARLLGLPLCEIRLFASSGNPGPVPGLSR